MSRHGDPFMSRSLAGSRLSMQSGVSNISRISRAPSVRSVATVTSKIQRKTGIRIPILEYAGFTDVQNGSALSSMYSILEGFFAVITGIFDIYCLYLAAPGSAHYGYYAFSYDFVYTGSPHIRSCLMAFAGITIVGGIALIVTAVMLLQGLRREIELRMEPWIWCMSVFTAWRSLVIIFASIVNDMIFTYHIIVCLLWICFIAGNVFSWLVVHSFYHELCEVTHLENCADSRMDTMSTMGFSSRPTTPGTRSVISMKM